MLSLVSRAGGGKGAEERGVLLHLDGGVSFPEERGRADRRQDGEGLSERERDRKGGLLRPRRGKPPDLSRTVILKGAVSKVSPEKREK